MKKNKIRIQTKHIIFMSMLLCTLCFGKCELPRYIGIMTTALAQETDEKLLIPDEKYWKYEEIDGDTSTEIKITGFNDYDDYEYDYNYIFDDDGNWIDEREPYKLVIPSTLDGKKVTYVGWSGGGFNFLMTNRKITSIVVPEGVEKIGSLRLEYSEVASIELPSTLNTIEEFAFWNGKYLKHVNIPANVTEIGYSAFCDCESLENIQLPESLYEIDNQAFYGCDSLKNIRIPANVSYIGEAAFADCRGMEAFSVDNGNKKYYEEDGVLCRKIISEIPVYGDEVDEDGDPVVDYYKEVERKRIISYPGAKKGEYYMDADTEFEWTAFLNIKGLTGINVDPDNQDYTSVDGVLYTKDMTGLCVCPAGKSGEYTVPEGVCYLQSNAFSNSSLSIIHFPDSLGAEYGYGYQGFIGNYCFYETDDTLHTVTLGKNITEEMIRDIISYKNIKNITISEENPNLCTVNNVIYDRDEKTLYWISPDITGRLVLPDTVEKIKWQSMVSGEGITELSLGKNYQVTVKEYYDDDEDEKPLYSYVRGLPSLPSLKAYSVSSENSYLSAYDGILYSKDMKTLYKCPPDKEGVITIPEGTTTILGESFEAYLGKSYEDDENEANSKVIVIPASVTDIQEDFYNITIKGYVGSAAEKYAAERKSVTFIPLDSPVTSANPNNIQKPGITGNLPITTQQPTVTALPALKKLKLSSVKCVKNTKKITGNVSVSKASVKIKVGSKAYKKATVKGNKFTLKLNYKLKKKTKITIKVSKKDYKSLTKTYKVK